MNQTIPTPLRASTLVLLLLGVIAPPSFADGLTEILTGEIQRGRVALNAIPTSSFVDSERPRLKGLLDDAESLLRAGRSGAALETLSSASPGVNALARAGSGWDDTGSGPGKHIDALSKEWEEVGRSLKTDRSSFASLKPDAQNAFVRGIAEQSYGQVDEYYAVAVDYGRMSGLAFGAYYLGRADGQMAFALFLGGVKAPPTRKAISLGSLTDPIASVEDEIVSAYAKPGSTAQHSNFILANSSLKLARELERHGFRLGSMVTLLRGLFALALATQPTPAVDQDAMLSARAEEFEKRFAAAARDESIGEAFVDKARISLEKSRAGGEAADRERLRAGALLGVVLPRYIEIMEGFAR